MEMETKYPTLRRPKRKLCYLANLDSPVERVAGKLCLGDIENMFDGLDSPSTDGFDLAPPSPQLQTSDNETNQSKEEVSPAPQEELLRRPMGPEGDALNPARSPKRKRGMASPVADLDIPFKGHGPIKTSSPIEENMVVGRGCEELNREKDRVVSPILFTCEGEEEEEEANTEPVSSQKPQTNGHSTQKSDDFALESPPVTVALSKPKMSCHKKEVERICKDSQPIKAQTPRKPENGDVVPKRKTESQKNKDPPVPAVRQEPGLKVQNKKSESVHKKPSVEGSTRDGQDFSAFLQKLREAGRAKPACYRKSQSPVKVPTPPPEPEEDFWILEDETPLWISIPTKNATSRKQRLRMTSSTDKDKETKETMKGKEKNEDAESRNETPELSGPEDPPAVELTEQGKQNKKKQRLKKVPSKESDKAEEEPEDVATSDKDGEHLSLGTEKKAQKPSEIRKRKPSKERKQNVRRPKKAKEIREVGQGCDAGKKAMCSEAVEEPREESGHPEEVGPRSDKEVVHPEAQTGMNPADANDKQNKAPLESDGSSAVDDELLRTRRRKRHQPPKLSVQEETDATESQPTVKKSKQNKEKEAAALSPVTAKKENVLKRKSKTECAQAPQQIINKGKEKKRKQKPVNTPGKKKATEKMFEEMEVEQVEELEEVPEESSPLDLSRRNHGLRTGDQGFQRVYYCTSSEKQSIPTTPASPRVPREQVGATESKRRSRKPPGDWWMVVSPREQEENLSSQPLPQEPKRKKGKTKKSWSSKPRTPKKGNVAVSSKPQGGAPAPLNVTPRLAPTVKQSLATFKDIFASNTKTPTLPSNRGAGRTNTHKVTGTDGLIPDEGVAEVLSMEAEEVNSPPQHDSPQDSRCLSLNMLKAHKSGPSSMIELQEYGEDDCSALESEVHATLSASDLCAPPLKPLVLQRKDKANLTEWLKYLWSPSVDNDPVITPDQFDWYFYKGRAIGFLVDLNSGTICNGKMLLGSHMKKPLWVDHSATSVFNLLTSSVSVTINGSESCFSPGQSFMVPCGHAYSIKNMSAQPAVIYFTRIYAESAE